MPAETQAAATETQVPATETQAPASTDTPAPESTATDTPAASQTPAMPSATPAVTETTTATLMTSATPTATVTATPTATRSGLLSAMSMSLSGVSQPQTIRYVYDGDGNLVLSIVDDVRTYYPGKHYDRQVSGSATIVRKYYSLNGQTVALRTVQGSTDTLNWILNDHLNSASVTAAADGSKVAELRYSAFGETRFSSGTTPTGYQYTGQLNASYILLSWYNSRWYDNGLGQFIQPDSIIPNLNNLSDWNRYSYTRNNPIRYYDPTGHYVDCGLSDKRCATRLNYEKKYGDKNGDFMLRLHEYYPQSPDWLVDDLPIMAAGFIVHEIITGNSNGYSDLKKQKGVVLQAVGLLIPGSLESGDNNGIVSANLEKIAVQPYEVGTYSELKSRSIPNDHIQIHHAPQFQPLSQLFPNLDYHDMPAIALPEEEHFQVNRANVKGESTYSQIELLEKTINDLQRYTTTPESSIEALRKLWDITFPFQGGK